VGLNYLLSHTLSSQVQSNVFAECVVFISSCAELVVKYCSVCGFIFLLNVMVLMALISFSYNLCAGV